MEDFTPKDYIVAYIDLLGTKQYIEQHGDQELLGELRSQLMAANALLQAKEIGFNLIKARVFSDNMLFCVQTEGTATHEQISYAYHVLSFFLHAFLMNFIRKGILFRGGIALGELYIDEYLLWGKALVDAVSLEEKVAIYPRIVIDPHIAELYSEIRQQDFIVDLNIGMFTDSDGLTCFDYFDYSCFEQTYQIIDLAEAENEKKLSTEKDIRIKQKLMWYKSYLDMVRNRNHQKEQRFLNAGRQNSDDNSSNS